MYYYKKNDCQIILCLLMLGNTLMLTSCTESVKTIDYAAFTQKNQWSHHYSFGSPSWDTFEHDPANPVYRGRKGMEWPVNGFLFDDPVSKNWFLYIGEYRENYLLENKNPTKDLNCVIFSSSDKGKTWTKLGDLFPTDMPAYDSLNIEAPDVMVIYADGRYHMIFDWLVRDATWENTEISGIGYAVADKPEGPFTISEKPLRLTSQYTKKPLLGKYSRMYAPMIIKREHDWAIIHMFDTKPARAWALAVATAKNPEGPYGDAKLVLNVEAKTGHPPLQEFYPAFTHDGYVYFPATSVAVNRNYQSVYRVKTEDLADPEKYEIYHAGSFWHSINAENEYEGIWGQTISGFVADDSLYVMYPSKDSTNYGTINMAKASWSSFSRDTGFTLSAHAGQSFTYLKKLIQLDELSADISLDGTLHILWDLHSPIDILNGWGKFSLVENAPDFKELVINKHEWKINSFNNSKTAIDSGKVSNWEDGNNRIKLQRKGSDYTLLLNEQPFWTGKLDSKPGLVGVLIDPRSYLTVHHLEVTGAEQEGEVAYGFYEALLSAGNQDQDWDFVQAPEFIYGKGAVSKKDSAIAKWNFDGKGFKIYAPKGPAYGSVNIYLDGKLLNTVNLKNATAQASAAIFESERISMSAHTVFMESVNGKLPVDCIKVKL